MPSFITRVKYPKPRAACPAGRLRLCRASEWRAACQGAAATLYPYGATYHTTTCNGYVYAMSAALLDLDEPWKVIYRGSSYLLSPQTYYECVGDVPNVAFPCATLYDPPTGRIAIYYGGADTVTALAFCQLEKVLDYLRENPNEPG